MSIVNGTKLPMFLLAENNDDNDGYSDANDALEDAFGFGDSDDSDE